MKNDQIVKLINKYGEKNEKISPDLMNNLLSANSELIDYILNSNISTDMLEKCFKYSLFSTLDLKTQILILENDNGEFGRLNDFFKFNPKFISKILKIIYNSKNSEALIYGERYLKLCKVFDSNELLIFKAILNSNNEDNASNSYVVAINNSPYVNCEKKLDLTKIVSRAKNPDEASQVTTNFIVLRSGFAVELTKIVADAKNPGVALETATNIDVLKSGFVVELTKIVADAKNPYKAWEVATNIDVLKSGFVVELTKIVADAKNPYEASEVARNIDVIESGFVVELTKIVSNAKILDEALEVARNINVLNSGFAVELTKIVADAKNPHRALEVARNIDVIESGFVVELTKIVSNAKNPYGASLIAQNYHLIENGYVIELTKIVADAKNPYEASEVATNIDVIESGHILKLTNLIANVSKSVATELWKMIDNGYIDIVIALIDVFEKRVNVNNFDAVISLITSGDYERNKNPIESLGKILRTTNDYKPFEVVYKDSVQDAVKGAAALDKAFPGIDIKGNTYIKTRKNKKENKHDNNE